MPKSRNRKNHKVKSQQRTNIRKKENAAILKKKQELFLQNLKFEQEMKMKEQEDKNLVAVDSTALTNMPVTPGEDIIVNEKSDFEI